MDTRWTDGFNFEWRLREFSDDLLLSYSCGKLFWRTSAEVIRNPIRDVHNGDATKSVTPPHSQGVDAEPHHLVAAIEQGMCLDPAQELYVRMRLWWNFNDPLRLLDTQQGEDRCRIVSTTVEHPDSFILNARKLIELFQQSDARERILIAELHRQLGNFDSTVALLSSTAGLFYALQELEREQSRLYQAVVRERVGDEPLWNCSARSEVLVTVARRILDLALEQDALVRPLEQQFAEFHEEQPKAPKSY